MKISFLCNNSDAFRARQVFDELTERKYKVFETDIENLNTGDALIIDTTEDASDIIDAAQNPKIVLLDGQGEEAHRADISISPMLNPWAHYTGLKYAIFPISQPWVKYKMDNKHSAVFVASKHLGSILPILKKLGLHAIVYKGLVEPSDDVSVCQDNCYDIFNECIFGIIDKDSVFAQAMYYGLPTISIDKHKSFTSGSAYISASLNTLEEHARLLFKNEYRRRAVSIASTKIMENHQGLSKVCSLIEEILCAE